MTPSPGNPVFDTIRGDASLATVQSVFANTIARSLASKTSDLADIRDWGVVSDTAGTATDTNTDKLLAALAATAGLATLHIPQSLTITVNPLIIPTSGFSLRHDGIIILAPNSANHSGIKGNLADFRGSNWSITGSGVFDGNKSKQTWSVGQVVGGLTSNTYSTTDTWLLDPGSSAVPIETFFIEGVTVQNVGNWPVSFGYATNGILSRIRALNSGNSPQFFAGAVDCSVINSWMEGITDAGFSLYAGTTRCSIITSTAKQCNQGFGGYCEDDTRPANTDSLVYGSTTIECVDGSIGFTTGGSDPTPTQIRPRAIGNRSINDGTSGTSGISCWGAVGASDVVYQNNTQCGFGSSAASGSTVNLSYFDQTTNGLIFTGNHATSAGSSAANANGHTFYETKNVVLADNTVLDSAGTMKYGFGGTLGSGCVVGPNYGPGTMPNGYFMEMNLADDTVVLGQRTNSGSVQYSTGVEITGGQLATTAGTFSAAGTTQETAPLLNTQISQVTGGTGGVLLPAAGTGAVYYVNNSTSTTIDLYPPSGQAINGNATNIALAVDAGTTVGVAQASSGNWVKISQT